MLHITFCPRRTLASLLGLSLLFAMPASATEEVNLYSARKEALIKPLLDQFTGQTGIKVNLVTGKADALLKRLETEGQNSPADLLLTTDAGRLHRAKQAGVLAPVNADKLATQVPSSYRDPDNYWFGLSVRVRPIMYVTERVTPAELSSYEALADDKWRGRICIRSSSNIYNQSLVASMIASRGVEQTEAWAKKFVRNLARPPRGGDRDQIKAAASGQCDIAVANTYYLGMMLNSKDEAQREAAKRISIFWPNQADRGAHVNVSGIALTKAAKNRDNAVQLMRFLVSDNSQVWYGETNHEYPIRDSIKISDTLSDWGTFKADNLNLWLLGQHNAEAIRIMDRVGWK